MCHHHVDETYEAYRERVAAEEREPSDEAEDPAVDVELDREYEEQDVKTPGDD